VKHNARCRVTLNMAIDLGRIRLLLFENAGSSIPFPFLLVLVFWLTIIFASFGLFAPRNATVVAAFLVTALSVSGEARSINTPNNAI